MYHYPVGTFYRLWYITAMNISLKQFGWFMVRVLGVLLIAGALFFEYIVWVQQMAFALKVGITILLTVIFMGGLIILVKPKSIKKLLELLMIATIPY